MAPPSPPSPEKARVSPDMASRTVNDAQLEQDIDAARQMSRARANSTNVHHSHIAAVAASAAAAEGAGTSDGPAMGSSTGSGSAYHPSASPREIASMRRGTRSLHPDPMEPAIGHDNDYLGMSASIANAVVQQPHHAGTASVSAMGAHPTSSYSPSSPAHAFALQQQQAAQAQAARFYMQHQRQGSNTSLDSASHFIDHRGQQANAPRPQHSPAAYRSSSINHSLQPRAHPSLGEGSGLRRASGFDTSAVDDEASNMHVDDLHNQQIRSPAIRPSGQGSQRIDRLVDIDGDASAPQTGNSYVHRTPTASEVPHTPSRRPSMVEDDVCFPMRTPGNEGEPRMEDVHGQTNSFERSAAPHGIFDNGSHMHNDPQHLPAGFPWTFDLVALEEYAEQERKRVQEETTASASHGWGIRNRSGAATIATSGDARRQLNEDLNRRRPSAFFGASPDSDEATFYSRRPRKFINVPGIENDNKSSNRYQKKLALFEGAGASPPPVGARASTLGVTSGGGILGHGTLMEEELARQRSQARTSNGYPVDTKTPLLDGSGSGLPSYQGTRGSPSEEDEDAASPPPVTRSLSVGADLSNLVRRARGTSRRARGAGIRSTSASADKQYRFTFYSNALASTIHARHIYELPAQGQTFEELLMGIQPQSADAGANEDEAKTDTAEQADRTATASAAHGRNDQGDAATSFGRSSAAPKPMSNLASALAGRLEGSTAPNTGANTPEFVAAQRLGGNGRSATGGGAANMSSTARTSLAGNLIGANMEKARAMPGGGLRVEQDPESCTWWLDVLCPTDQEMKMLSRVFGIHPLTTEDILMEETREKIELFRNYYLVCFRSFDQDPYSPTYLEPLNMYVIVFREGTLSFHFRATPHPQNVRRRIKQLKDYISVTSDWISYALIDDITDAFGPLIQSIEYEVDSIDELVLILKEAEQSDMLRRIGTCRKKVMGLLRLMGNKADVVKGLAKRCNENWTVAPKSDIGLYLSDIQDHLITMTQNLNHYEKILSRSHSNYLAQISIEMTDANNQINDVLSKLTALGTVIVPLNVITGLWGMNVNVPGQGVENLHWFFGILAVMIALAVVGYFATIRYLQR